MGYGNSEHNICKICNHSINGVSLISQKLFWSIYNKLNLKEKQFCKFSELNIEKKIYITDKDKYALPEVIDKLNKNCYFIDFIFNNKIIEFDGTYYHKDKDKYVAKDKFLNLKGYRVLHIDELKYKNYPEQIFNKCIQFLKA